jgi:hypothetical protein
MAICKTCGRKYSRWTVPVSAKGVCEECFALELENESQTDPKEHLSAPRSTPGHLDDAPAETSPSPRRQSNAEEQVRHSVASEMKQLHISTPNGQQTTYPEDQIRSLWQRGLLVDSALYWEESMIEWRPLREYFAHARSVAPPEGLPGHGARQPERVALRQRSLPSPVGRAPDEKYAPERSHDVERSPNKGPRGSAVGSFSSALRRQFSVPLWGQSRLPTIGRRLNQRLLNSQQ